MDRPVKIMHDAQGGRLAGPAWTAFMTEVYRRKPPPPDWPRPDGSHCARDRPHHGHAPQSRTVPPLSSPPSGTSRGRSRSSSARSTPRPTPAWVTLSTWKCLLPLGRRLPSRLRHPMAQLAPTPCPHRARPLRQPPLRALRRPDPMQHLRLRPTPPRSASVSRRVRRARRAGNDGSACVAAA